MQKCKKCGMLKMTEKQKCYCDKPVFKWPSLQKKAPKPIALVWEKRKERVEVNGSDIQHFLKRFKSLESEKKNICWITGKVITKDTLEEVERESGTAFMLAFFPHIFNKKNYPALRYYLNNIGLVYGAENHKKFDAIIQKMKDDIGTIKLEKMILDGKEIYDLFCKYR